MDESTFWGVIGILLALGAVAVMLFDGQFVSALGAGEFTDPIVWYVAGVVLAALVTVVVFVPRLAGGE
ncbi:MAG: hypothetical protein ABEJ28_00750 [Salinigranum sp.]